MMTPERTVRIGGGPVSRRMDPLGKGMAQILLDMPVRVPQALADSLG
jgi:hypothetical protein